MDLLSQTWTIEFHSGIPVYKQIIHHIEITIAEGKLREGEQLPTIRALHEKLKVNPNTVAKAYRELEFKGTISTQRGSGCYVAPQLKARELSARDKKTKVNELCARFAAEAEGHGIRLQEIIHHINQKKSYA